VKRFAACVQKSAASMMMNIVSGVLKLAGFVQTPVMKIISR
jgi:hypothetical protein